MIRGLTQQEIARRIGGHQPNVSAWLSGRRIPSPANLERLAEAMGTKPEDLLAVLYRRHRERQGA
jgi:transcriptional regulator with XRE-family HTH domain